MPTAQPLRGLELPRSPPISTIQERAGAGTPPSLPSPTAPGCGGRRRSRSTFADLDFASGQLRVRQGTGKKPRQAPLAPSAQPAFEDWLQVRGREPGPLFCAVLKTGRLVREGSGGLRRLSGSAAWAICKDRSQKAGIQAPAPHDLRRTWVGDLLEFADLATVQRMAGHASVATTARYDRRDHAVQRKAAA